MIAHRAAAFVLVLLCFTGGAVVSAQPVVVGSLTDVRLIDYPGAVETFVNASNASDDVVGDFYLPGESYFSGYLLQKGVFTPIRVPGALETFALGINDRGDIIGMYRTANPGPYFAYLLSDGEFSEIAIPGAASISMIALNDGGTIVGGFSDAVDAVHGFVWRDGTVTQIDVPGALETVATGINSRNEIVGYYMDQQFVRHGFAMDKGGITSVDVPVEPAALYTIAWGIASSGTIVGECLLCGGPGLGAGFVFDGGTFVLLSMPGAETTRFFKITSSGVIAGVYADDSGLARGLLARR